MKAFFLAGQQTSNRSVLALASGVVVVAALIAARTGAQNETSPRAAAPRAAAAAKSAAVTPVAVTPVAAMSKVTLLRTPDGGIQPQAALDAKGVAHLIYFKGDPAAGDVFYVRGAGDGVWSKPLRVNSQAGSAIATGTIRGAQIALGRKGRVHVAWNGSDAAPKAPGGAPMLYARRNDAGTAFEAQRNVATWAGGLDGGGTLAADARGHVYVTWHAAPGGGDESQRAVFLARSSDDGKSFERERKISPQPTGACGCCAMRAFVDGRGALYITYRAAGESVNRDMTLLTSRDAAATFQSATLHRWKIGACPMSSESLAQGKLAQGKSDGPVVAAWETEGQVYRAAVAPVAVSTAAPATTSFEPPQGAPGTKNSKGQRKHPALAADRNGATLLAWTEGTGWAKGGALAWQVYDKSGVPLGETGRVDGVPVWSLPTTFARPGGGFVLIY